MKYFIGSLVAFSLGVASSTLNAQRLNASPTGIANPTVNFDFNSMPLGSSPAVLNGVDFGAQFTVGGPGTCGAPFPTRALFNNGCSTIGFANPLTIRFSVPTTGVAINLFTNSGFAIISTWLGGANTATMAFLTEMNSPQSFWYGFEFTPMDRLEIYAAQGGGYVGIDNVQVTSSFTTTTVPEPASVALFSFGLVALLVTHLRRRLN